MGNNLCSCNDKGYQKEEILPSRNDILNDTDFTSGFKSSVIGVNYYENQITKIQSFYKSYKVRIKIKKLVSENKKIFSIKYDKSIDEWFKWCNIELTIDNLNALISQIKEVYQIFFNLSQIDICKDITLKINNLDVSSGEEFEANNKRIILLYMKKNQFEMNFLNKSKPNSLLNKDFSPDFMDSKKNKDLNNEKSSSLNSSQKQSIINTSNYKNTNQLNKSELIFNNDISNNALSANKLKIDINKSSNISNMIIKDLLPNSKFDDNKLIQLLSQDDLNSQVSDSTIKTYLEYILFTLNEYKANCEIVTIYDDKNKIFYEGAFNKISNCKCGLGFSYIINAEKGRRFKYLGYFNENLYHGLGIYLRDDGYSYQGEFRKGKRTGFGYECISSKYSYRGFFIEDKFNGYGVYHNYTKKATYYGTFTNNQKDGIGYIIFNDRSYYSGLWSKNQRNGKGLIRWSEGHSYFGSWQNDKMHGQGIFEWKKGDKYKGMYSNDLRHGDGIYYYSNGSTLQGKWLYGKKEGAFIFTNKGKQMNVEYKNDVQI